MTTRRLSAIGAAEPAVAWERYAVIGAWPTWSPQIVGVETAAERIAPIQDPANERAIHDDRRGVV